MTIVLSLGQELARAAIHPGEVLLEEYVKPLGLVSVGGASLTTGTHTVLFPFRPAAATTGPSYAVAQDGQRFLLSAIGDADAKAALSIVQNWTEGIRR